MGHSRGYVAQNIRVKENYVTTVLRRVIKNGVSSTPENGRRRETAVSRPTAAKKPMRRNSKLAEETEIGDTAGL